MPNIILSEGSEKLSALYGKIQAPIASYLQKRGEAFEQASIAKEIFIKHPSTHWAEGYGGLTGMNDFELTPENGAYPTNGLEEGYFQTIQNYTWKSSFSISREMVDDGKLVDFKKKPESFIQAAYRTQERFFAQMLGTALQGKTDFTLQNQTFSTKSADGLCMFSNAHKAKVSGDTIVNAYTDAFSKEALGKAATAMQNMKGDNGETLGLVPDTIVIPNIADLKDEVFAAIASRLEPGTENKYNYLFGNWRVLVWPYLNDFLGGLEAPWIILDSSYNQAGDCAIWQERVPLEVRSELADNDANKWKGYMRFGGGFVDFRGMIAGGMSTGGTL